MANVFLLMPGCLKLIGRFTMSKLRVKNFCRLEFHLNLRFFKAFYKYFFVKKSWGTCLFWLKIFGPDITSAVKIDIVTY
jgi:hypothetical protein